MRKDRLVPPSTLLSFPIIVNAGCRVISSFGHSNPRWITDWRLTVRHRSPPVCHGALKLGGFAYSPEEHRVQMRHEANSVLF